MSLKELLLGSVIFIGSTLYAQTEALVQKSEPPRSIATFSSEKWCEDQMTIAFSEKSKKRPHLSGIRLIFEPQLGVVIQPSINKITVQNLQDIPKFALETNLWQGWISFQSGIIYPSTVSFEDNSDLVKYIKDASGSVTVNFGYSIGITILDGIIALGYGSLQFDRGSYTNEYQGKLSTDFWYFNIQPTTLLRSLVKNTEMKQQ